MTAHSLPQDRLVALALELPSRAAAAESLDELYFILTNDLRSLAEFDRCFLITHLEGESRFVSATHQPVLEGKSRLQDVLADLSFLLAPVDRPLVLSTDKAMGSFADQGAPDEALTVLQSYAELAGWKYLCCVPLQYDRTVLGHLLMEWFDDNVPDKNAVMALVKLSPVFGAALAGRWLIEKSPRAARLLSRGTRQDLTKSKLVRQYLPGGIIAAIVFLLLFFMVPITSWVGGEAVVAPRERQYAFCKISGLIDTVYVRQGSHVKKGQKLAVLDHRELDLKIRREERQLAMLTEEMTLLRSRAIDDPSILAKTKQIELKKESVQAELDFLRWQSEFLIITAPADGAIVSKDVETFSGKRLEGGEPFCEIAELDRLCAEIYVPEERIMRVSKGQKAYLYLNNAPRKGYRLEVQEVAPRSEVQLRLGNVYKVTATFADSLTGIKVGMKGIGSIDTGTVNLWAMLSHRLAERWNQAWLHLW
jgi:hypothetical protein